MHRLFRLSFLVMLFGIFLIWEADAQRPQAYISGKIEPNDVRILLKDTTYIINRDYVVAGTLIIEPGTTVLFYPNGRLIDSVGGRIIADGFSKSVYNQHPDGITPLPGHSSNLARRFTGYYDLRYFGYRSASDQTIKWTTDREKTIHSDKYNLVYNLLLDTAQRKISTPRPGIIPAANQIWISYEEAIMFTAAKLHTFDPVKNLYPLDSARLSIKTGRINFIGQPVDNFSREWGHIIILPGAGISFFRNCTFDGFRKDTTVDRTNYYGYEAFANHGNWMDMPTWQVDNLNNRMRVLTNGSGGAITTFSSRTWLIDCEFKNNMARHRGGAVQFLQAPNGLPTDPAFAFTNFYPAIKNPNITERDGAPSNVNAFVPVIDYLDEQFPEPVLSSFPLAANQLDFARQAYDDGRMSIFLGRFRNITFTNNKVLLSNIGQKAVGTPPVLIVTDLDNEAGIQKDGRNTAAGGAMYIYGSNPLEIGLGVNNSIYIKAADGVTDELLTFEDDTFEALNNNATSYQPVLERVPTQQGAVGGAVYVGNLNLDNPYLVNDATSLIVAGAFKNNSTVTPYINEDVEELDIAANFSKGGAIYTNSDFADARLQVRGGPARVRTANETEFINNSSGVGGAIYVEAIWGNQQSPVLGGHDVKSLAAQLNDYPRDYGFNVLFQNNAAQYFGGAIYTERSPVITGAGGIDGLSSMGYGGVRHIRFIENTARYAGGAIDVDLSNRGLLPEFRAVQIIRAEFSENKVGFNSEISADNKAIIRGGGAIYSVDADINLVKGTEFRANKVMNGNGAAIALIRPIREIKRFFLTDLDNVVFDPLLNNIATNFVSNDDVFTFKPSPYPAQTGMLTRFLDNEIVVENELLESQSGSGTTQIEVPGTIVRNDDLFAITFLNQETGFAVGENGTIVKITEEGTKWEYVSAAPTSYYTDIAFVTNNIGYATSVDGFLARTVDGGMNWAPWIFSGSQLNAIAFNGSKGAVIGNDGFIGLTNDGGTSWGTTIPGFAAQPINFTDKNLYGLFWADADNLWIIGSEGTIIKVSTLGGWEYVTSNTFNDLNSLYFVNANVGYIVGEGAIVLKTTNGGISWEGDYRPENVDFNKVSFKLNTGFIIGENGVVLQTTDAGETWAEQVSNTDKELYDLFFVTPQMGYMVGENESVEGTTYNSSLMITRDGGATWNKVITSDTARLDVVRYHPHPMVNLPENGIGLGGAIYVLDVINADRALREDSVRLNRVRFQDNKAYSGAAVYSDNYNLNFILTRCLVTGNEAIEQNDIGILQNAITGPYIRNPLPGITEKNVASSDLVGSIFYANVMGPLPANTSSIAANSIYDNNARFLFRLPDAPNTKGVLVGTSGIGYGGIDTLRSNYWGHTEANVNIVINNVHGGWANAIKETFFIRTDDQNHLGYIWWNNDNPRMNLLEQGPFESINRFNYQPIPLLNVQGDENEAAANSIPEKLLMSGFVYDIYDKGTDIKTADYSNRRMSPIEDFAVGIPPKFELYSDASQPSNGRYVKRYTRDPFVAEALDENSELKYPLIAMLQEEFYADKDGTFFHPVGYPLYLETKIDYEGFIDISNHDPRALNETVFFVVNESTGDYIRVNMRQFSEDAVQGLADARSLFRARVELVPDSTNRSSSVIKPGLARRISEGLPTYGSLFQLLDSLNRNPYNEDAATLLGRKYYESTTSFANKTNLFSNRPDMPQADQGKQTFFAGERYTALPVNVGDSIYIISRSYLWQHGPSEAIAKGLHFVISGSVNPPDYTGDIPALGERKIIGIVPSEYPWKRDLGLSDTIWNDDFINKVHLTENRVYPVRKGSYSDPNSIYYTLHDDEAARGLNTGDMKGRDSILAVTAVDLNNFIDPMSLLIPTEYTNLSYMYKFDRNNALLYWLWAKMIPSSSPEKDGAAGWMQFNGKPINPFVVPEGEWLTVRVDNYPPHWRTVDKLKKLSDLDEDYISKFINLFRPYLNAPLYTGYLARFLQADTIDVGSNYHSLDFKFNITVVNEPPKFLPHKSPRALNPTPVTRPNLDVTRQQMQNNNFVVDATTIVVDTIFYQDSYYTCDTTLDGKLIGNVTDKLRFQADFNTDDEMEDAYAARLDWEFPFGRLNYSLIDRPNFMGPQYLYVYGSDTDLDPFAVDLTTYGKVNIRIPAAEARQLLKPVNQYNRYLVNDTVFTILAEDGHGGLTSLNVKLFINYAPEIITQTLPDAKEDYDYNPGLLDSAKMINVFDANFGQEHRYELVYEDYPFDQLDRDPCFAEAGVWDLSGMKTTPKWLKINETSGLLYGVPSIGNAPKDEQVTVVVWDMIDGERKIPVVKTFNLFVDSTNHAPHFVSSPAVQCIDYGKPYEDFLVVSDRDLLRANIDGRTAEELTVTVTQPTSGLSAQFIGGGKSPQGDEYDTIRVWTDNFDLPRDSDGKITIKIEVKDKANNRVELVYRLKMSDLTNFVATIKVENSRPDGSPGAFQLLEFGTANPQTGVTTGDGSDNNPVGILDYNFCEFELPPIPNQDIFDVRWQIPQTNGTLRNIYPKGSATEGSYIYRGIFQAGGEKGNTGIYYPIHISWNRTEIPQKAQASDPTWWIGDAISLGNYFSYNMSTGEGRKTSDIQYSITDDVCKISIASDVVNAFVIYYDWTSSVDQPIAGLETAITSISPNPFDGNTNIHFEIGKSSKVRIEVVDQLGNVVALISDADYTPGQYTINWNAKDLSSGTYTCRMVAGSVTSAYKMIIVK
ncbi:MAG: T9SS type A sorting domain-containing protein [Ignavibacteria bacterium]|nr:T9SS type A sorting domain-containing protein [Ignavibacteria bacterium]